MLSNGPLRLATPVVSVTGQSWNTITPAHRLATKIGTASRETTSSRTATFSWSIVARRAATRSTQALPENGVTVRVDSARTSREGSAVAWNGTVHGTSACRAKSSLPVCGKWMQKRPSSSITRWIRKAGITGAFAGTSNTGKLVERGPLPSLTLDQTYCSTECHRTPSNDQRHIERKSHRRTHHLVAGHVSSVGLYRVSYR